MSILEFERKIKGLFDREVVVTFCLLLIIIGVGIGSYFIGKSDSKDTLSSPVLILTQENLIVSQSSKTPKEDPDFFTKQQTNNNVNSSYVASKNGTRYYPASCGAVSRIKEENRVFFSSGKDAEDAGFSPSLVCN